MYQKLTKMYQNRQQVNLKKGIAYVWFLFTVVFAGSCGEEFGTTSTDKAAESKAAAVRSVVAKHVEEDPAIVNMKAALAKRAAAVAGRGGTDLSIAKIKAELAKRKAEVTARKVEEIKGVWMRRRVIIEMEAISEATPTKIKREVVAAIKEKDKREAAKKEIKRKEELACSISEFNSQSGILFEAFEQAVKAIIEADPRVAKKKEAIAKEVKEKAAEAKDSVRQVIEAEVAGEALREIVEATAGIKEAVIREVVERLNLMYFFKKMEAAAVDAIVAAAMGNPACVKKRSAEAAEGVWKAIDSWLDSKRGTP